MTIIMIIIITVIFIITCFTSITTFIIASIIILLLLLHLIIVSPQIREIEFLIKSYIQILKVDVSSPSLPGSSGETQMMT